MPDEPNEKDKKPSRRKKGNGFGTVFQRKGKYGKPGLWVGMISAGYDANGKRKRRTIYGKTRKEVQDKLAAMHVAKASGRLGDASKLTVAAYLDQWLHNTARQRVKGQTLDNYEYLIKNEIKPRIGGDRLSKLTKLRLKWLYSDMQDAGKSPRLRQMVHAVLRKSLADAVEDDVIPFNPAAYKSLRPKAVRPEMQFLNTEQLDAFLKAAESDRLYAMYVLAVLAGLRQGELFALRPEDIELDAARLSVRRTLIERKGHLSFGEPKSAAGRRTVSLSPFTVRVLWEHKARMLAEGNAASETVFCTPEGTLLRKSNVLRRSFRPIIAAANKAATEAAEKAGTSPALLPNIRFHDLRHSHATALLKAGQHPKVVQTRLGHSQISLTMDTYSHALESMDRDAASRIDGLFAQAPPPEDGVDPKNAAGA